jgi:hypothetical protein
VKLYLNIFYLKRKKKMERKNTWNNLTRKPGRVPHYREKKEENNLFPLYEGQHRYRVRNIKSTPKKKRKKSVRPSSSYRILPLQPLGFQEWKNKIK